MIPRPVRYRARRLPEGPPVVEFQQGEGERWFPLAAVDDSVPFAWGTARGAEPDPVQHLAGALLLSRVSIGEASELVDDMAALVERMPPAGWEMTGASLGRVVARLILGQPVPDPAFPLDIEEQQLAALFGAEVYCHACSIARGAERGIYHAAPACKDGRGDRRDACPCGSPFPRHLAELGLAAHVCRCRRRYRVEGGVFIPDGEELNPFAEAEMPQPRHLKPSSDPDWTRECENCGEKPVCRATGLCGPCTFGEAETAGGNW